MIPVSYYGSKKRSKSDIPDRTMIKSLNLPVLFRPGSIVSLGPDDEILLPIIARIVSTTTPM